MLKRVFLVFFLLGIAAAPPGWSQSTDALKKRVLPDFDARDLVTATEPASSQHKQATAMVEQRRANIESFLASAQFTYPGTRIALNRYGLPKLFLRDGKSLSTPSAGEPEEIAKSFLRDHASIFPFSPSEVDGLRLLGKDVTASATFLAFNQTLEGIDVFNAQIKFTLNRAGEVIQVATGDVTPGLSLSTTPRLSPEEAVRAAFDSIGGEAPGALSRVPEAIGKDAFLNPRGDRYRPITAELSIFPMTASSARLAYRIFLEVGPESWYEILIDAENGSLLFRHNLYVFGAQARVWTQSPMVGERQLVTFPDGWLPANGTVTTGNNVDAYLDATGNDSPDPVTNSTMQSGRAYSANQIFDFSFGDGTVGLNPRNYQASSVTNLFYFVNLSHDYYYSLGFTEAAWNFQTDNFGRGGTGSDALLAEAQYGGFTNNSSFGPTPDGTAPRMRIGLYTRSTSTYTDDLDSDYNGQTVFHEYGHGVSTRIAGAGTSTSCLNGIQSGALGEGWSDYFAISMFNNPVYGAYQSQNSTSGIRRQSYEGYTFTYQDIGNGSYGYEVHDDGEIWAAALWDLRKSLGPTVTDQLVVNGLKSTPCGPSMTDARDAILSADQATNGGANRTNIWQAFAKHGMGYSATGVDGNSLTGTRYDAAYDLPPDLQTARNPAITSNPLSVATGVGDQYSYQVTASNPNGGVLNYALTQGPAGMAVDSASGSVSWIATFVSQRVKITVTDGTGANVVHGYLLPVVTFMEPDQPKTISGEVNSLGYAYVTIPANVSVLQVTTRNGTGDADLLAVDPDGYAVGLSVRDGSTETLSFASPKPGRWEIVVGAYITYSGVSLAANLVTPAPLSTNTTLTGLSGVLSSETLYRVTIPEQTLTFKVTTSGGSGDVDIYLRRSQPALCQASSRVSTSCYYNYGSSSWSTTESITVANPAAGDWYLDLSGYGAYSGVTLTTTTLGITTSSPLPSGSAGAAYSQTLAASGGIPPYTWAISSGTLPPGLALSSAGAITGTPTTAGTYSFTVRVTDSAPATITKTFSLTVVASLAITTSSPLPSGYTGAAYSQTLAASGGTPPYTWAISSGTLPAGLALSSTGAITGTPTGAGTYSFTVSVTDSASTTATKTFNLTVVALLMITTSSPLPSGSTGTAYSQTLAASGGTPPYTWAISSGALPAGLALSSAGAITGTPTGAGTYSFTVRVTDSASRVATQTFSLTISPPPLTITTSSPLVSGFTNGTYSQTLTASGGVSPYTWTITSGTLPPGLALSSAGAITGTPTTAGTYSFTVRVADSASTTATQTFGLTVVAAATLTRAGALSQIGAGGGWDSTILLINTSSAPVAARLVFHNDDGSSLSLPLSVTQQGVSQSITTATLDQVINSNATLLVNTASQSTSTVTGWVDVLSAGSISGAAIFRYTGGGTASEGTAPLQSQTQSTIVYPYDNTLGFSTGVALVNLSTGQASITATIFDGNGSQLGAQTITVAGSGHTSFMLPSNLPLTAGKRGIVKFQNASGGALAGIGLRFSPLGTFTSLPVILP